MRVAGLLHSKNEAKEIQYIAKVSTVASRIHFIVRREHLRTLLKIEEENHRLKMKK